MCVHLTRLTKTDHSKNDYLNKMTNFKMSDWESFNPEKPLTIPRLKDKQNSSSTENRFNKKVGNKIKQRVLPHLSQWKFQLLFEISQAF